MIFIALRRAIRMHHHGLLRLMTLSSLCVLLQPTPAMAWPNWGHAKTKAQNTQTQQQPQATRASQVVEAAAAHAEIQQLTIRLVGQQLRLTVQAQEPVAVPIRIQVHHLSDYQLALELKNGVLSPKALKAARESAKIQLNANLQQIKTQPGSAVLLFSGQGESQNIGQNIGLLHVALKGAQFLPAAHRQLNQRMPINHSSINNPSAMLAMQTDTQADIQAATQADDRSAAKDAQAAAPAIQPAIQIVSIQAVSGLLPKSAVSSQAHLAQSSKKPHSALSKSSTNSSLTNSSGHPLPVIETLAERSVISSLPGQPEASTPQTESSEEIPEAVKPLPRYRGGRPPIQFTLSTTGQTITLPPAPVGLIQKNPYTTAYGPYTTAYGALSIAEPLKKPSISLQKQLNALLSQAKTQFAQKRYANAQQALSRLEQLMTQNQLPAGGSLYAAMAEVAMGQKNWPEAQKRFEQALSQTTDSAQQQRIEARLNWLKQQQPAVSKNGIAN